MILNALTMIPGWVPELDGWIIVIGALAAMSAASLGVFIVLRGASLLGDAISHAVLPGIAIAYLVTGSRGGTTMFVAAVMAAMVTVFLIETLRRASRIEHGASMGVVFTAMFALGVVLMVSAADQVDLDPNCVLYGSIELTPLDAWDIADWWIPKAAVALLFTLFINLSFIILCYKELKISTFDESYSDSMGVSTRLMHYVLMTLVAITAVASFESVGSILFVAMLVVPVASALMVTARLFWVLVFSLLFALSSAALGHLSAVFLPQILGYGSTLTAGMMAVVAGGLFAVCGLIGPRRGWLVALWRQRAFATRVLEDDLLKFLYRQLESPTKDSFGPVEHRLSITAVAQALHTPVKLVQSAVQRLAQNNEVEATVEGVRLSAAGMKRAQTLVRSHRLWELYLVEQAQVEIDRIHDKAERWEHVTDEKMRTQLDQATSNSTRDPHGSRIPPETNHPS